MRHRHLDLDGRAYTRAALDDVIARGSWRDWADLRRAALERRSLLDDVAHVCRHRAADPYAQRHHFWLRYAEKHRATT